MQFARVFLLIMLSCYLSSCQSQSEQAKPALESGQSIAMVGLDEVVGTLDNTCGVSEGSFDKAKELMKVKGMTNEVGDKLLSPNKELEGYVFTTSDGVELCWIKSRFPGDLIALQGALSNKFGGARHSNLAYFGSVRMLEYDRREKGKMLLHLHNSRPGTKSTIYSLGYVI